jgi:peptide chain release factor 2
LRYNIGYKRENIMKLNAQDFTIGTYDSYTGWMPSYNGVTITHIPTGISVHCHTHRSQWANREQAFKDMMRILVLKVDMYEQMELFND